jgi:hypothetical protein
MAIQWSFSGAAMLLPAVVQVPPGCVLPVLGESKFSQAAQDVNGKH